jgi:hypothetical protein
MGERAKGKDKGKSKKKPKTVKPGTRPHEQQERARTMTPPPGGVRSAADDQP